MGGCDLCTGGDDAIKPKFTGGSSGPKFTGGSSGLSTIEQALAEASIIDQRAGVSAILNGKTGGSRTRKHRRRRHRKNKKTGRKRRYRR